MTDPATMDDLTEPRQSPLSKAMTEVDKDLISDDDFSQELATAMQVGETPIARSLVEREFSPSVQARALNNGFAHKLTECDRMSDALSSARATRLNSIQALLDEKQAVISRETSRLLAHQAALDDLVAEQENQKESANSDASRAFLEVERTYATENAENDQIKVQILAALAAGRLGLDENEPISQGNTRPRGRTRAEQMRSPK